VKNHRKTTHQNIDTRHLQNIGDAYPTAKFTYGTYASHALDRLTVNATAAITAVIINITFAILTIVLITIPPIKYGYYSISGEVFCANSAFFAYHRFPAIHLRIISEVILARSQWPFFLKSYKTAPVIAMKPATFPAANTKWYRLMIFAVMTFKGILKKHVVTGTTILTFVIHNRPHHDSLWDVMILARDDTPLQCSHSAQLLNLLSIKHCFPPLFLERLHPESPHNLSNCYRRIESVFIFFPGMSLEVMVKSRLFIYRISQFKTYF
jgi:hypothetical protein